MKVLSLLFTICLLFVLVSSSHAETKKKGINVISTPMRPIGVHDSHYDPHGHHYGGPGVVAVRDHTIADPHHDRYVHTVVHVRDFPVMKREEYSLGSADLFLNGQEFSVFKHGLPGAGLNGQHIGNVYCENDHYSHTNIDSNGQEQAVFHHHHFGGAGLNITGAHILVEGQNATAVKSVSLWYQVENLKTEEKSDEKEIILSTDKHNPRMYCADKLEVDLLTLAKKDKANGSYKLTVWSTLESTDGKEVTEDNKGKKYNVTFLVDCNFSSSDSASDSKADSDSDDKKSDDKKSDDK